MGEIALWKYKIYWMLKIGMSFGNGYRNII